MQTTLSKLIFYNLSRQLCRPPKASFLERCVPAIDYSTSNNPGRPMRGESRRDDGSEDLFLRSLNFGDDGSEEQQMAHRGAPPDRLSARPPLRGGQQRRNEPPLRGEDGTDDTSGDVFPDLDFGNDELGRTGRGFRGRSPNRPMRRGPPREDFDRSPQSSFKDFGRGYMDGFGTSRQRSPSQSPSGHSGGELDNGSPNIGSGAENFGGGERARDRSTDSLVQKFNLGEVDQRKKVLETDQKPPMASESATQETPPEDADEIFKKMKETGLIPNAVSMLDGLCKDGLVQDAMKLFGLMREKGTIPEVVIYTAVVEGFCKATKFDDAKRIFRKMQKNGIVPNAYSYKVLIQGLCKARKLEDSVEFCMEMVDTGHSPSAATLIGLVDGFCKEKGVEEAENVLGRLQERGFLLDEKAVREHLDKKGPFSPMVWETIFGKKNSRRPF